LRLCAFARVNKKYFARKAAKASGSQTEPITISLRLCVFARRKSAPADEKGAQSRQAAKASGRRTGFIGFKGVTALLLL